MLALATSVVLTGVVAGPAAARCTALVAAAWPTLTSGGPEVEPASRLAGESAVLVLPPILLGGPSPNSGPRIRRCQRRHLPCRRSGREMPRREQVVRVADRERGIARARQLFGPSSRWQCRYAAGRSAAIGRLPKHQRTTPSSTGTARTQTNDLATKRALGATRAQRYLELRGEVSHRLGVWL